MKIAISGSTGFIGKQLSDYLLRSGHELIMISRSDFSGSGNQLAKVVNSADVIINLAGSSVLCRWNDKNREKIISSRITTTRALVEAVLNEVPEHRPEMFINTSAIGIYGNSGIHDEFSSDLASGFLASVCKSWENEIAPLNELGVRVCRIRLGIVLGTTGGSLAKMVPIFKAGLGGRIGAGNQPFSFIHISDLCNAIEHMIEHQQSSGVYNMASPEPATNKSFTFALAKHLHRPAFFAIPEFILKLIYGEAAELLTRGTSVKPARLLEEGFRFTFPDINSAVADLVRR